MLSVARSSADSIVETSGRKIIFPPFDTLGDEPYSPYHKVDAETLRSPAIILIVPYASRAKFPVPRSIGVQTSIGVAARFAHAWKWINLNSTGLISRFLAG